MDLKILIFQGKKKIKKLSKNIRGDGDDTSYGLDSFDSEIERCSRIVEEKEAGKTAALAEFDEHTANAIKAEIESENLPVIEEMEVRCAALKEDMIAKQAASQSASANLAGTYGAFLGTKNATPEKIDELIKIINSGQASTIMQAIDCLNGEIKTQQQ